MTSRIGISSGACTERPILDILPCIHRSGATAVEVGTPPRHFDPWQRDQITAVRRAFDTLGLRAVSIHAPFGGLLDLADSNPAHRHAAVSAILTAAHALKQLGGDVVVVHPSDLPRPSHGVDRHLAACLVSLQELSASCRHEDLTLAVESPLPHLVGGHPDEFGWLLRRLDDSVKVCLDTGHLALGGYWHRFLDVAQGRLVHVHANDNHGTRDDHLPPGDGQIDWREIAGTLRDAQFDGWIMLELRCHQGDAAEYFRHALEQSVRLFGRPQ
jgi:sugar phosphate isomerase/epimerase